MSHSAWTLFHLRVTAEPDPSSLPRILGYLTNLNITPRRVLAEWATTGNLHIQVDFSGLPEQKVDLITSKIAQLPTILNAHWHL